MRYIFPESMKRFLALAAFVCLTVTIFSKTTHAKSDAFLSGNIEVCFSFSPSVFTENIDVSTEPMFLVVKRNGEAKVVNYGVNFWSDNILVHQGNLPKDYVAGLISKARRAITEASRSRRYEGGPQDEPVFYLSLEPSQEQRTIEYLGLLEQPDNVRALVSELRVLWKRLRKVEPAYAYVRRESIGKESPDYIKRDSRFKSVRNFPHNLRPILINAIREPLNFYALDRSQVAELSKFISSRSLLYVTYNGYGFGLTLFLPKTYLHQSQKGSSSEDTIHPCQKTIFLSCARSRIRYKHSRNRLCR